MKVLFVTNDYFDLINSRAPFASYLESHHQTKVTLVLISNHENADFLVFPKTLNGLKKLARYMKSENYTILIVRGVELSIILSPILAFCSSVKRIIYITGLGSLWGNKLTMRNSIFRGFYGIYIYLLRLRGANFWAQNEDDLSELRLKSIGDIVNGSGVKFQNGPFVHDLTTQILFAGRITYEKGFDHLITLAGALPDNWNLIVCGELDSSISKNDLEIFKTLAAENKIEYMGFIKEMPQMFERCSFAFYPTSYREGTPRFVLEAMGNGLIPVIPYVPGCKKIIDDGKAINMSSNNWQEKLLNMDDEIYVEWVEYNRHLIEKVYSREAVYKEKYRLLCSY